MLLVPEKYMNDEIDFTKYCDSAMCQILVIENGNQYLNHDPMTAAQYGWVITDPIVNVKIALTIGIIHIYSFPMRILMR